MDKKTVALNNGGITEALDFVSETLKRYKQPSKTIYETMLLTEETMVRLMTSASEDEFVKIKIFKNIGIATVTLSVRGTELSSEEKCDAGID